MALDEMSILKYRSDIDGLRALAVISVIIFHINKSWLNGGFVGVDIFFVISGYLITGIIYRDVSDGVFSFTKFYNRRVKRILPVFFIVVISSIAISSLIMLPADFMYFMKSAGSTLLFSSNMFFGYAVDYFSPNTDEYPLLHTWSLAVEEQYYIIFPFIILLHAKILKKRLDVISMLSIFFLFSLLVTCVIPDKPSLLKYNYYWLPSRAYELMIGSITAIVMSGKEVDKNTGSALSITGILLIAVSLIFIKESPNFPGMIAVVPCIGTAFILASGSREAGVVNKILSLKPIVIVGLISYSLYLWHWPILSLMRYISNDGNLTNTQIIIAVVLMFIISYITWRYIETPVRKSNIGIIKSITCFYIIPSFVIGCFVYGSITTDGYPQRFGNKKEQMEKETTYMVTPFCHNKEIGECKFGDVSKKPDTYMIGDSHAGHYSPMMDEFGKKLGFSFIAKTVDACYPLLDVNGQFPSNKEPFYTYLCPQLIKKASIEYKNYKNIVFAGVWSEHFRLHPEMRMWLENEISTLTEEGHNVFIIEQVPMFKPSVYDHAFRQRFSLVNLSSLTGASSDMSNLRVDVDRPTNIMLREIVQKYKNAYIIDPMTELGSENNKKLPFFNDHLVYRDNGHLNEYGSRMIADEVVDKIPALKVISSK